jgi:hypothetical protein
MYYKTQINSEQYNQVNGFTSGSNTLQMVEVADGNAIIHQEIVDAPFVAPIRSIIESMDLVESFNPIVSEELG